MMRQGVQAVVRGTALERAARHSARTAWLGTSTRLQLQQGCRPRKEEDGPTMRRPADLKIPMPPHVEATGPAEPVKASMRTKEHGGLQDIPASDPAIEPGNRNAANEPGAGTDPWILPLQPGHQGSVSASAEDSWATEPPLPRPNEQEETKRARLLYQARKRGIAEMDLLMSTFAKEHLPTMSERQLAEFDELLDEPDWPMYYMLVGKRSVPDRLKGNAVLEMLLKHSSNEGKALRQMPKLEEGDA